MKQNIFKFLLVCTLLFQTINVFADEDKVVNLEPIIVTARGLEYPISKIPGSVGILDSEEIEQENKASITDITRNIAGVEKSSDSPWGSEINIRGLGRNRIIALSDSMRINTATDLNGQFGLVNIYDIERVEILKGSISSLYGTGSIGGVANIITKKGHFSKETQEKFEIINSYGSNPKGFSSYLSAEFDSPKYWLFFSGSYRDYEDTFAADDKKIENSQYMDEHQKISGGYLWNSSNATEFEIKNFSGKEIGIPGKGESTLTDMAEVTYPEINDERYSLTHTITPFGETNFKESKINVYTEKIERRVRVDHPNTAMKKIEPQADHTTTGLKWTNHFEFKDNTLLLGLDLWEWKIDNTNRTKTLNNGAVGIDSSVGNVSQKNYGFFIEDTFPLKEKMVLNLGARVDAIESECDDLYLWEVPLPSQTGSAPLKREGSEEKDTSYQLNTGISYSLSKNWTTSFAASSSYRAPDLMDRFKYINLGGGKELSGNPDLEPERSYFFEYTLNYTSDKLFSNFAIYSNFLKDMITEKEVSSTKFKMDNIDKAEIFGSEFELKYKLNERFNTFFNIAYTNGKNKTTDEYLPFIPPLNGDLGLSYSYKYKTNNEIWAKTELEWAASQDDVPTDRNKTSSWQIVNISTGYSFIFMNLNNSFALSVNNIFDKDYQNYLSTSRGIELKEPGRNVAFVWKIEI